MSSWTYSLVVWAAMLGQAAPAEAPSYVTEGMVARCSSICDAATATQSFRQSTEPKWRVGMDRGSGGGNAPVAGILPRSAYLTLRQLAQAELRPTKEVVEVCAPTQNQSSSGIGATTGSQAPQLGAARDNSSPPPWALRVQSRAPSPETAAAIIDAVSEASAAQGVEPALLVALIEKESGFRPGARGASGEVGLCQIMPATARMVGYSDVSGIRANVLCGATHLANCIRAEGGDVARGLARYNGGPSGPRLVQCQGYARAVLALREEASR